MMRKPIRRGKTLREIVKKTPPNLNAELLVEFLLTLQFISIPLSV